MQKIIYYLIGLLLFLNLGCKIRIESAEERTQRIYGKQIEELANNFNLPSSYLKALIILECSGQKDVPSRFEKKVYYRLQLVKQGKLREYQGISKLDLANTSDDAIKNLASSWGPFQIMGYKCIELGVKVEDVRGENSLYWSVFWIDKEYGGYLRKGLYAEAFRIHNTGSPTGKTFDSKYVTNGLAYIKYFKSIK